LIDVTAIEKRCKTNNSLMGQTSFAEQSYSGNFICIKIKVNVINTTFDCLAVFCKPNSPLKLNKMERFGILLHSLF